MWDGRSHPVCDRSSSTCTHSESLLQTHTYYYSTTDYNLNYIHFTQASPQELHQAVGSTLAHYLSQLSTVQPTLFTGGQDWQRHTKVQFVLCGDNDVPQCIAYMTHHINLHALTDFPLKMPATSPDTAVFMPPLRSPARYSVHTHRTQHTHTRTERKMTPITQASTSIAGRVVSGNH